MLNYKLTGVNNTAITEPKGMAPQADLLNKLKETEAKLKEAEAKLKECEMSVKGEKAE